MADQKTGEVGTILDPDAWAIVWSRREGFIIHMPILERGEKLPEAAQALMAAGMRLDREPEFAAECAAWLAQQVKG